VLWISVQVNYLDRDFNVALFFFFNDLKVMIMSKTNMLKIWSFFGCLLLGLRKLLGILKNVLNKVPTNQLVIICYRNVTRVVYFYTKVFTDKIKQKKMFKKHISESYVIVFRNSIIIFKIYIYVIYYIPITLQYVK